MYYPNEKVFGANDNVVETPDLKAGMRGLVPRNMEVYHQGMLAADDTEGMPLIDRAEWPERIADREAKKQRLSDLRMTANNGQPIKSYDQNGQGYCWAYSTTAAVTMLRATMNLPHERLSAHSVAWTIKKGRDQGGWAALSLDYAMKNGICYERDWPAKSMNGRKYGTDAAWNNAKENIVTEAWLDIDRSVYDRNVTLDQVMTALLTDNPCALDFYWWGHSVMGCDPLDIYPNRRITDDNRWGVRIWNSWTDNWSAMGMGVLKDGKHIPNGGVILRSMTGVTG